MTGDMNAWTPCPSPGHHAPMPDLIDWSVPVDMPGGQGSSLVAKAISVLSRPPVRDDYRPEMASLHTPPSLCEAPMPNANDEALLRPPMVPTQYEVLAATPEYSLPTPLKSEAMSATPELDFGAFTPGDAFSDALIYTDDRAGFAYDPISEATLAGPPTPDQAFNGMQTGMLQDLFPRNDAGWSNQLATVVKPDPTLQEVHWPTTWSGSTDFGGAMTIKQDPTLESLWPARGGEINFGLQTSDFARQAVSGEVSFSGGFEVDSVEAWMPYLPPEVLPMPMVSLPPYISMSQVHTPPPIVASQGNNAHVSGVAPTFGASMGGLTMQDEKETVGMGSEALRLELRKGAKRTRKPTRARTPVVCDFPGCEKTFSSPHNLAEHKQVHKYPRERMHKCLTPGCNGEYFHKRDRRRHERKKHGAAPAKSHRRKQNPASLISV